MYASLGPICSMLNAATRTHRLNSKLIHALRLAQTIAMPRSTAELYKSFDSDDYLRRVYYDVNIPDKVLFRSESLHKAYQKLPAGVSVLEYGAGPTIFTLISAASRASRIVLADPALTNRQALLKWLRGDVDPTAFNWSPYFDHVVQELEGKNEWEAREREELVRQVVKDVIHCDIHENPPVQKGYEGPYDVVVDSWCLAYACKTRETYEEGMGKLASLVSSGGTLMIFASQREQPGLYSVGPTTYHSLPLSGEYVTKVLQGIGLSEVSLNLQSRVNTGHPLDDRDPTNTGYMFVTAKKLN